MFEDRTYKRTFYSAPQSVAQLVDFIAAKVLDTLGVEHDLMIRWTGMK